MEKVGSQKIWSYFDEQLIARSATNEAIRAGSGHEVKSYFELAKKVAELQFRNREHVMLFRGQIQDHKSVKNNSSLKPSIFRRKNNKVPSQLALKKRFARLREAEDKLVVEYSNQKLLGFARLRRQRVLRWAILQHYDVCGTPLLDVTQSLRIAASFASTSNCTEEAFLFAFGVPNLSGAVTASSEAGIQIVRLSSACPPDAVRPHIQEGYLLGEYPEISDFAQHAHYGNYEVDFGRRLLAKFRFNPRTFWKSVNYPQASLSALYPSEQRDSLPAIAACIRENFTKEVP